MAARVRRRLTAAHGRRFALGAAALVTLGGALAWRSGRGVVAGIAWAVAASLAAVGLLAPERALLLRAWWIGLARYPARVMQPVVLTAIFLVVVTPMGVLRRTLGRSPMRRDRRAATFWVRRDPVDPVALRRRMERQF